MCALCGVLGGSQHWTDAAARPRDLVGDTTRMAALLGAPAVLFEEALGALVPGA